MKVDPNYLSCKNNCSGSIKFHVINIRSDIEFVFFSGGFLDPCIVARSTPLSFSNPKKPLYGHLSSIDSTATSVSNKLLFCFNSFVSFILKFDCVKS